MWAVVPICVTSMIAAEPSWLVVTELTDCFTHGRACSHNRSSQSMYSVHFARAVVAFSTIAAEPSWLAVEEVIAPRMGALALTVYNWSSQCVYSARFTLAFHFVCGWLMLRRHGWPPFSRIACDRIVPNAHVSHSSLCTSNI